MAYGALIRPDALALPKHGWVNLHFSLLPAWRGAAPVQHALIAGDEITGASVFALDEGLDTGPVYGVLTETVRPDDTAGALLERLAQAGAGLLVATLDGIEAGEVHALPQSSEGVSLAPKITADDARVDWTSPVAAVERRIRGCTPDPGAWTTFRGERLGLGPARLAPPDSVAHPAGGEALQPGQLAVGKHQVTVGGVGGDLLLGEVRPAGRRPMAAADWARGVRPQPADRFQ